MTDTTQIQPPPDQVPVHVLVELSQLAALSIVSKFAPKASVMVIVKGLIEGEGVPPVFVFANTTMEEALAMLADGTTVMRVPLDAAWVRRLYDREQKQRLDVSQTTTSLIPDDGPGIPVAKDDAAPNFAPIQSTPEK